MSIVTYRGSNPRSIVVEALRQRSRQWPEFRVPEGGRPAEEADKGRVMGGERTAVDVARGHTRSGCLQDVDAGFAIGRCRRANDETLLLYRLPQRFDVAS